MQLFNAGNDIMASGLMSILLESGPNSAPILQKKVKEIEKNLSLAYPLGWNELSELSLIRRLQLKIGSPISENISSITELVLTLEQSIESSGAMEKNDLATLKKSTAFAKCQKYQKSNRNLIKEFLSLSIKGLEIMSFDSVAIGVAFDGDQGLCTIPQLELTEKMIRAFLPGKKDWKILDATSGFGQVSSYLFTKKKANETMALDSLDTDEKKHAVGRLYALAEGRADGRQIAGDLLTNTEGLGTYDAVICNIPWGEKTKKSKNFQAYINGCEYESLLAHNDTVDWAYAVKMLEHLNEKGVGIWFTNSRFLTSPKNKDIVNEVIERNLIASIVRLPKGVVSNNETSPVMVVFKKGRSAKEKMIQVDIRLLTQKGKKTSFLPTDSIVQMATGRKICPLCQSQDSTAMLAEDKDDGFVLLKDVTLDIFRGTDALTENMISDKKTELEGGYMVLRLNDFAGVPSPGKGTQRILLTESEKKELGKFELKKGDILIKSRGGVESGFPFSKELSKIPLCFVYDGKPEKVLATASFMVVRPDPSKLDSLYLKFYLQSRIGMEELNLLGSGKNSFLLTKGTLGNLKLPLPNLEKQRKLGVDCMSYSQAMAEAYQEFEKRLQEFTNYLYHRFTKGEQQL